MLVDKTEFEAWMERIMGELYRISRKLDKAETREKHLNYLNGERLYDNQEVCLLLRISKRTLQRYRNNGVLFDISQDILQGVGLARVHPQQLRRERDKTAGT